MTTSTLTYITNGQRSFITLQPDGITIEGGETTFIPMDEFMSTLGYADDRAWAVMGNRGVVEDEAGVRWRDVDTALADYDTSHWTDLVQRLVENGLDRDDVRSELERQVATHFDQCPLDAVDEDMQAAIIKSLLPDEITEPLTLTNINPNGIYLPESGVRWFLVRDTDDGQCAIQWCTCELVYSDDSLETFELPPCDSADLVKALSGLTWDCEREEIENAIEGMTRIYTIHDEDWTEWDFDTCDPEKAADEVIASIDANYKIADRGELVAALTEYPAIEYNFNTDELYADPKNEGWRHTLVINPESRSVYTYSNIGHGYPSEIWHRHQTTVALPRCIDGATLLSTLRANETLIRRVIDSFHGIEWNGHNHVGRWSNDRDDAVTELETELEEAVMSVEIWSWAALRDTVNREYERELAQRMLDGEDLDDLVNEVIESCNNMVLSPADVRDGIESAADELREEAA